MASGDGAAGNASASGNALPPGWILRVSRSKGKVFYYHTAARVTQWTRPTHEPASRTVEPPVEDVKTEAPEPLAAASTDEKKRKRDDTEEPVAAVNEVVESDDRYAAIARCMRVGASRRDRTFTPWSHQVDAVHKLLAALDGEPRTSRFLLQHSTGSGKTVTIAALAHQLLYFEDQHGQRFHSVLLLIDRIKLDEQVGDSVERFLRRNGVDAIHRANSIEHLASLLTSKGGGVESPPQRVVITTIQKIGLLAKNPVLLTRLLHGDSQSDPTRRDFSRVAIITDEAHRSHTAATRQTLELVMSAGESDSGTSAKGSSVTFVGFTATPNTEALELFGSRSGSKDALESFHCYSMSQAVDDKRIVDVLQDYESVRCEIETTVPETVKTRLLQSGLMRAVMDTASDSVEVLMAKSAFMMNDFQNAKGAWNRSKCMVVTRSRRDVVRYNELITAYVRNKALPWRVFAVFSGAITTESDSTTPGVNVTEQSLNPKHATLASSDIVIVCDKLDTGYSDPLLARMYIDRYLRSSSQAVQLLSRLNRMHPDKKQVRVVDFANHVAQIRRHFATFWREAKCHGAEDPGMSLADLRTAIVIVCDAIIPWELDVDNAKQMQERVNTLARSVDRDAFQQLHEALRFGLVAWDALTSSDDCCVCESLSPLRRRHFSALKNLVEQALNANSDDDAVDGEGVTQKMKTRVQQYTTQYRGSVDPMQLHTNDNEDVITSPKKTKCSGMSATDLTTYEQLLALLADVGNRSKKGELLSAFHDVVAVSNTATKRAAHEERVTRLAAFIASKYPTPPLENGLAA